MFLYSLTIQPPTNVVQAVLGQFAGTKEQLIITGSGSQLTLLRPDPAQGKVIALLSHDIFGILRSIAVFRLAGSNKDYIILATDSGRITILEYLPGPNRFNRLHMETFGKSGIRRVVPGEYLACDPKGRACLISAVEKNKLVYVLNRNSQAELTISSPLEAHKPGVLVIAMVALDVGYANPVFAALEIEYTEVDQDITGEALSEVETQLVYYELDLGLNHVVRKWSDPVDPTASLLFQVPGGNDGPSGVLVCGEENITYRHSNQDALRVPIPRRRGATEDPSRKRNIVAGVMHKLKGSAGAFFFLLQSDDGDLFKITIDMVEDEEGAPTGEVQRMKIKYFDTVPVATSLCILKSGFLYVASQFGNYAFYQFEKLGDDDDEVEFSSEDFPVDPLAAYEPVYFYPRLAENLALVDSIPAMNPLLDCKVANLTGEDAPQIFTICGNGARSTFRTLKHGLEVNEIVASELPGVPSAVWTLKLNSDEQYDAYIVLSFTNGTLVLSIGETVEEVSDSGFLTSVPTIAAQLLGTDGLIQVHPRGIRHIRNGNVNEWSAPQHRSIVAASTNSHQVAIALSSGEIVYFEMDSDGSLAEYDEKKEMFGTVTALSLGEVPEGRVRSSFLAVGCDDSTVRILSLDPESTLENKSVQALTAAPTSLAIIPMDDSSSGGSTLYLHIGLHSGVYLRTVLDEITGELTDTRQKFLGPKPVRLFQVTVGGRTCVLGLSSRPWLGYANPITSSFEITPLSYVDLEWGWNFSSEQCEDGVVGIQGQSLRIFSIDRLGETLLQSSIPLTYTPKKFVKHPDEPLFYTIEADNHTLPPDLQAKLLADPAAVNGDAKVLPPEDFGHPRGNRRWASCISVVDPVSEEPSVLQRVDFENNEAAVSVAVVSFASQDNESFLVVGTGKDIVLNPRSSSEAYIYIYRFQQGGRELEFIHKTKIEEPATALLPFQGKLLAGIGKTLRMYDLGMRQLLRKAQAEVVPQQIVSLNTQGSRIVVSDVQQGVTLVVYKSASNKLIPFVDDSIARWSTCTTMVDYESVAGGDKFGNMFIVRSPAKASEEADEDAAGLHLVNARDYLHGTQHRLELMCHFFTQDILTSINKTGLVVGGQDVLLWSGIMGTIGVFIPFVSREDTDFFQSLEQHLRTEDGPLAGRDHLMYRSYYAPVKGVIDGDLCERFSILPNDKKQMIAGELDRSVREIERKISDIRARSAF
ncbi:pre-mRNA splicing factor RSE1 [Cordyceps militaris CM01]|uniref:Pre-mRNA-splicing factor RSE1 n=2 Tax=Cordyceps militaris TaxID=73501 RepID=G3J7F8_CORMM|nr:pre-mRNA splicing factor RSE1 [Cordyceps militaris CM01]EGX97124.1 pre-mRNA splicing factor RSE1 [Cordyceps militaris CM01]